MLSAGIHSSTTEYENIMRSLTLSCAAIILLVSSATAQQIPNAGFEAWTNNAPDNWATSNAAPAYTNVTKSTTAHGGSASVRGEVVSVGGFAIQPALQSGAGGEGFAISSRPVSITGWYQYSPVQSDRFSINVSLFKGGASGTPVAIAAVADPTAYGAWHQFSVPFNYLSAETPDVCIIQHQIVAPLGGTFPHAGSWFLLDDLAFSGATDVANDGNTPHAFALHQNFPNPFNPGTVVRYDLPAPSDVRLAVFDMLGRQVAVLVQERKPAGQHSLTFNAGALPSGTYLVRLQADGLTQTRSMLLVK